MLRMRQRWIKMRKFLPDPSAPVNCFVLTTRCFLLLHMYELANSLCLRIFRGLGFLPSKTPTSTSITTGSATSEEKSIQPEDWSSILVRSDTRNTAIQFDISTIHLKSNEISPLILADQLWKAAE